jgi:hypothetical protein
MEGARIHLFTATGEYLESHAPRLPCAMPLPRVAGGTRSGFFIHGGCLRGGGGDTMALVLFWTADGEVAHEVVADPRFTTDGGFGTGYGPDTGLSDGATHHLFGAGVTPCVYRIVETDTVPVAQRVCDEGLRPHRLELSAKTRASIEAKRRRNPLSAGPLRIPAHHPPYMERVVLAAGDGWLRGWSEDSLVLRLIGDDRDLAVLPHRGLIGCRRSGCLWATHEVAGVRIRFLPIRTLDSLAWAAGRAPAPGDS